MTLRTDSRTVASWLRDVVENLQRSRTKGLHEVLVQRRLQIVADLIQTAELDVSVVWVESHKNRADVLTRVPSKWLSRVKETESPIVAGAVPARPVTGAPTLEQIKIAQKADPEICAAVESLLKGDPLPGSFSRMKSQLVVDDGLLCRSVKLPVDGEVVVPVIPATLEQQALRGVHETAGHCTWSSMHDLLRAECYFPGMAKACRMSIHVRVVELLVPAELPACHRRAQRYPAGRGVRWYWTPWSLEWIELADTTVCLSSWIRSPSGPKSCHSASIQHSVSPRLSLRCACVGDPRKLSGPTTAWSFKMPWYVRSFTILESS